MEALALSVEKDLTASEMEPTIEVSDELVQQVGRTAITDGQELGCVITQSKECFAAQGGGEACESFCGQITTRL